MVIKSTENQIQVETEKDFYVASLPGRPSRQAGSRKRRASRYRSIVMITVSLVP